MLITVDVGWPNILPANECMGNNGLAIQNLSFPRGKIDKKGADFNKNCSSAEARKG